jgi:ketosteroid isomerase-like protein
MVQSPGSSGSSATLFSPEFEFIFAGGAAEVDLAGTHRGFDGMAAALRRWMESWEPYFNEPEEFLDAGERVLVLTRVRGRSAGHGIETEAEGGDLWTLRDGKVVRIETFLDRDAALRAAGLTPQSGQE